MPDPAFEDIHERIAQAMLRDRPRLARELQELRRRPGAGREAALRQRLVASCELAARRRATVPVPSYPPELPVSAAREEILDAIRAHQVVVVAGETGSGKTTQLPKLCLEAGRGVHGMIGHTQPRRLAARSVADRISSELGSPLGECVGYQVRFQEHVAPHSLIKLMTDGVLLNELRADRDLLAYDTIIVDEAHERSLNIDFLLGYLYQLLARRADLKLVITSATIDVGRFSRHFDHAPVIEVSGRAWPVELRYRPPAEPDADEDLILAALAEIDADLRRASRPGARDVLVFLPGEREIRETALRLRRADLPDTEILPLYARLGINDQQRIFKPHQKRRIVLATNVAETSLTVPGIGYVIDSGRARISRYSLQARMQQLPIEPISQASARQRAGRCGRISEGVCIRLYAEDDYAARPEHTAPELLRTNLAAVMLQMADLGLGPVEDFPFIDAPDPRYVRAGQRLLEEIGALKATRLTRIGRKLARLPLDPQIGRMLLAAAGEGALSELLVIAAALSIPDPRERPPERRPQADQAHALFREQRSDFLTLLKLWQAFEERRGALKRRELQDWCRRHFLSPMRMWEWRDVHRQLLLQCRELKLARNQEPADYAAVHRALLAGLPTHIGKRQEDGSYLGCHGRRFRIFPDSALAKRGPEWIIAAELVETGHSWGRTVAGIEPGWLEAVAPQLLKRQHADAYWAVRRGQAMTRETVSLYGLVLVGERPVPLQSFDPGLARELFIREVLVQGNFGRRDRLPDFLRHNQAEQRAVHDLEHRLRRRDLGPTEAWLEQWYAERIPADVSNLRSLNAWLKKAGREQERSLYLHRGQLLEDRLPEDAMTGLPEELELEGLRLPLRYSFRPGGECDGVSVMVPRGLLRQVDQQRLQWLVPGLLEEKIIALMRALPKALRRHFVPVPDHARAVREALQASGRVGHGPLGPAIGRELTRMTGVQVPETAWDETAVGDHLRMRIVLVDESGREIEAGRDLPALAGALPAQPPQVAGAPVRDWTFGTIADRELVRQAGLDVPVYPALQATGDGVVLLRFDHQAAADAAHRAALLRLLEIHCVAEYRYLQKKPPVSKQCLLEYQALGSSLADDLYRHALLAFLDSMPVLPRDEARWQAFVRSCRGQVVALAGEAGRLAEACLLAHGEARRGLQQLAGSALAVSRADMQQQLTELVYAGFIARTPPQWLPEIPRYLKALQLRMQRLAGKLDSDQRWAGELATLRERWQSCKERAADDPQWQDFPWLLQEYRVSLFAQELGTRHKVSAKRLGKLLEAWQ